jgi:ribulose-5-phosphate 4-epimerase/fuculose-1-phosphate aldolase
MSGGLEGEPPAPGRAEGSRSEAVRAEMVEACRAMNRLGINQGHWPSGNIGVRWGGCLLISPFGHAL